MTAAYWSIVVAFAMIITPRLFAIAGQFSLPGGFDYSASRDQQALLTGMARRAQAAHLNGCEGFGPFAAAVILSLLLGTQTHSADLLAGGYAVTRILFVFCYLADLNPWRTLVWLVGIACNIGIYVHAAGAVP